MQYLQGPTVGVLYSSQLRPLLLAQFGIVSLAQQQVSAVVVPRQHAFGVELCHVCIIYSGLCSC
jgi:hypothetical protein